MSLFGKKPADNKIEETKVPDLQSLTEGTVSVQDVIAPSSIDIDFNAIKINETYYKTIFAATYPRYVGVNWLSPIINFNHALQIGFYYYPQKTKGTLDDLRKKIAELQASISLEEKRGRVVDPKLETALEDAENLLHQLARGEEQYFRFSFYVTIEAENLAELKKVTNNVEGSLSAILIGTKQATLQMEQGFQSTIPACQDKLLITRNLDTTSIASTFPFTSSELTANDGILYGLNEHNGSLIIFDRFSLENPNSVVFAKAGAGKSYMVKLEALRSLMFGTEIIIIDPENEYENLSKAVGGEYIQFSQSSTAKINPFDLSGVYKEGENTLGLKILSLHTLFMIIFGEMTPTEEAILDRALVKTYANSGITPDPETQTKEVPTMEDLYKVLLGFEEEEANTLSARLEKFIKGSLAGIFNTQSTIDINNPFTVFSVRDLEESLKPIAIYIILDYVWTKIRKDLRKRLLIVDEAWYMMQRQESANFLYSIAKRCRKYYLGLTTITQDVEDFLATDHGKAIITNSSLQILLKQSTAAIDRIGEVFFLTEGEKQFLISAGVGEGLFFAGENHVAMQVVASPNEHDLVTTNPKEVLAQRKKLQDKIDASKIDYNFTNENEADELDDISNLDRSKEIEDIFAMDSEEIKEESLINTQNMDDLNQETITSSQEIKSDKPKIKKAEVPQTITDMIKSLGSRKPKE